MKEVLPAPPAEPQTFAELFGFYHDYVKVLYSFVQTENMLPNETLFELNAALDHLSRQWIYGESEARVVSQAYGHLKRSCLDIFKLQVREAREQYTSLRKLDTSVIDNGNFDRELHALFAKIREGATEARRLEGDRRTDSDGPIRAFDRWQEVLADCIRLERDFFLHPALDWARKRFFVRFWRSALVKVILGAIGGIAGTLIARTLWAHYGTPISQFW